MDEKLYDMIQQYHWVCYIINGLNDSFYWVKKDNFSIIDKKLMITEEDGSIVYGHIPYPCNDVTYNIVWKTLTLIYDILYSKKLNSLDGYTKWEQSKGQIFNDYFQNWVYTQVLFYKLR